MTDEKIEYSAGPYSEWANGGRLEVRIRETKYSGALWFKVFFGSDREPIPKQPLISDIEWKLYLSRDSAPKSYFSDIELGDDVQFFLFDGSYPWMIFSKFDRAIETYESVTNQIRTRLGFRPRPIPESWRRTP